MKTQETLKHTSNSNRIGFDQRSNSAFERATELVRQMPNSRYSEQNNSQKDKKN